MIGNIMERKKLSGSLVIQRLTKERGKFRLNIN